ncbi:MAG: hypothetical protein QW165_02255 [Candidatus Woesearchaeota archaeon]
MSDAMPVLERTKITKEDLGELANVFLAEIPFELKGQLPVAHFYLVGCELCIEAPDYSALVLAEPNYVKKFASPKFVAVYDSTSENGTHRIAIYRKNE